MAEDISREIAKGIGHSFLDHMTADQANEALQKQFPDEGAQITYEDGKAVITGLTDEEKEKFYIELGRPATL